MSFQRCPMPLAAALVLASLQSCVPYKKSSLRFGSGDQKAVTCAAGEVVEDGACVPEGTLGDPPPPDPGPVNGQAPVPIPVPSPVPNVPATFDVSVTTLENPIAIRLKAS